MINYKLHTSCKNCIFAIYKDITQTGCKLNLINKFHEHDIETVEVYDEEKEFYVINNSKCMHMRTKEWTGASQSEKEQIKSIHKETQLRFHVLVLVNNNIQDVKNTLNSLITQTLKPVYITLIRQVDSTILPTQLKDLCKKLDIEWRIENLVQKYTIEEIHSFILPFVKHQIYITFNAGFKVPKECLYDISNAIVNNYLKFVMLLPNSSGNGMVSLKIINEHYVGQNGSLEDRLRKDGCPSKLLIPITKLLPYFPK